MAEIYYLEVRRLSWGRKKHNKLQFRNNKLCQAIRALCKIWGGYLRRMTGFSVEWT